MHQSRYRAVIALDPVPRAPSIPRPGRPADSGGVYRNHTRELVLCAGSREKPGGVRGFATELCWDDEEPLHPGDRHIVTVTVTDDGASEILSPGERFTLWSGGEVGHGTISRRMFSYTEYGPF